MELLLEVISHYLPQNESAATGRSVMKRRVIGARVGVFCLAVMVATCVSVTLADAEESASDKGEKQVAMKDVPSAVRAAAEKAIAGGSLKGIVVEKEDGQVAYSVEAMTGGKTKEFTFATDGTLLAEEEDVAFAKLPEAVRAAAEKYFGDSRDLRASIETAKSVSVKFGAQGALLEDEEEED